ncbi:MAG: hypothetical protein ACOX3R_16495 [Desulfitobacteriia bacterium]
MTYLTCGARVKELILAVAVEVKVKAAVAFSAFSNKNRLSPGATVVSPMENL